MLDEITSRFDDNIQRVEHLVTLYGELGSGHGGRRPVNTSDILRAATVFLHATLEDFLRGLARWQLPAASAEVLNTVPLAGASEGGRPSKFFLGELNKHRGKTVDKLIVESVEEHLGRVTYNDTNEIAAMLSNIGLDVAKVNSTFPSLDEMMKRRHHIVHQADRNESTGSGHHKAKAIGVAKIQDWIWAVRAFANGVAAELRNV